MMKRESAISTAQVHNVAIQWLGGQIPSRERFAPLGMVEESIRDNRHFRHSRKRLTARTIAASGGLQERDDEKVFLDASAGDDHYRDCGLPQERPVPPEGGTTNGTRRRGRADAAVGVAIGHWGLGLGHFRAAGRQECLPSDSFRAGRNVYPPIHFGQTGMSTLRFVSGRPECLPSDSFRADRNVYPPIHFGQTRMSTLRYISGRQECLPS